MSSRLRKVPKTRSSRKYCQENYSCQQEKVEALYECSQCETLQCKDCEADLHALEKFKFHDREIVEQPHCTELCEHNHCESNNFADVYCETCSQRFCFSCFERAHSIGKKKAHKSIPFKKYLKEKTLSDNLEEDDEFQSIPLSDSMERSKNSLTSSAPGALTAEPAPAVRAGVAKPGVAVRTTANNPLHARLTEPLIPDSAPVATITTDGGSLSCDQGQQTDLLKSTFLDNDGEVYANCESFMLSDEHENIKVASKDDFIERLGMSPERLGVSPDEPVKVISIFGNTGDGKSHTLNHTFFGGKEVFSICPSQMSCTIGVWAAFDPVHKAIALDTEGLLGVSSNQNQRTRLLLKTLAVSDIIIYRTRAERLHNDLFQFLSDASVAYKKHFLNELNALSKKLEKPPSCLGPSVVIFHETQHTEVLDQAAATEQITERFSKLDLSFEAFSSIDYVGIRTPSPPFSL